MVFKNELYPIHFYGRVRGKCDGRLQNWPGIVNERPKFLAKSKPPSMENNHCNNDVDHLRSIAFSLRSNAIVVTSTSTKIMARNGGHE